MLKPIAMRIVRASESYLWDTGNSRYKYIGSSEHSDFIPVYAMSTGTTHSINNVRALVYDFRYSLNPDRYVNTKRISLFMLTLGNDITNDWRLLKDYDQTSHYSYAASGGIMFSLTPETKEAEILVLLTLRKSHLYKVSRSTIADNRDAFCVLLSKKLFQPEHARIYRALKKHYIDAVVASNVDMIYTDNIEGLCYNTGNCIKRVTALTIEGLQRELKMKTHDLYEAISPDGNKLINQIPDDWKEQIDRYYNPPPELVEEEIVEEFETARPDETTWDGEVIPDEELDFELQPQAEILAPPGDDEVEEEEEIRDDEDDLDFDEDENPITNNDTTSAAADLPF